MTDQPIDQPTDQPAAGSRSAGPPPGPSGPSTPPADLRRRDRDQGAWVGGLILIVMGILIVTGEFKQLNIEAQNWLSNLGLDFWNQV